jgi:hypothetical protein
VEARAKLDGRGLGALDPQNAAALLNADLHFLQFGPTNRHLGALVYEGRRADVSFFAFEPDETEPASDRPVL